MYAITLIAYIGGLALILAAGGFIADHILPRIPAVKRFIDSFETEE